jgi:hypothetical protein
MHVFGHENEGSQFDICLLAGRIDASGQPFSPLVIRKKRQSVVTRKC